MYNLYNTYKLYVLYLAQRLKMIYRYSKNWNQDK